MFLYRLLKTTKLLVKVLLFFGIYLLLVTFILQNNLIAILTLFLSTIGITIGLAQTCFSYNPEETYYKEEFNNIGESFTLTSIMLTITLLGYFLSYQLQSIITLDSFIILKVFKYLVIIITVLISLEAISLLSQSFSNLISSITEKNSEY